MIKLIKKTIFSLYLALAFLTPLLFSRQTGELYEFPKMFFVYFLGTTIMFLYFVYVILAGKRDFRRPHYLVLGYLAAIIFSFIFSTHYYTSLWGYYSRFNGGLVSFLVFFGLYFVALDFFDENRKEKFKDALCLGMAPVSLYGLFQITESVRVFSTLGQPNWLAAYLVFLLPLLLERILHSENRLKRFFWIFTLIISLTSLLFSRSLSGLLGLLLSLLFLGFRLRKKIFNKWSLGFLFLLLILLGLNFGYLKARVGDALVFSTDPGDYNVSDPGLIRLGLWQGSLAMATSDVKSFLLGSGPETFAYEFPFYRRDFLNYTSEWDFILNKPHNYYLEVLVESGLFALIFYLGIVIHTLRQENHFLAAGFLAFFVTNIFSWPTVMTSLIFWLWLALIPKNTSP